VPIIHVRAVLLTGLVVFAILGMLIMPTPGQGQASRDTPPTSVYNSAAASQVLTIPAVTGMSARAAIDSLRWTKLRIVQLDSITSRSARGVVISQRPRAGTPVYATHAETLFVAVAPRKPSRGRISWGDVLGAVATAIDAQKPPRSEMGDDVSAGSVTVPTEVPNTSEGDPETVPGHRVQDRTRVPDLFRSTPVMVSAALEKRRLTAGKVMSDYSDDVPRGRVFRQDPQAGQEVVTYTEVAVWYSIGPHPEAPLFSVPGVLGLELAEAADSLKRSGFRAGNVDYLQRRGAEGKVVHQSPNEGEPAHRNDAVALTITTAPSQVAVPSVLKLTREAARQRLQGVGLNEGRFTLVSLQDRVTGIVSQTPREGAMADSGALVDLVENRPAEVRRVQVPDLSGKSVAASDTALRRDSLVLGDVLRPGIDAVDRVVDQRPQPGQTVFVHSAVTIALGAGLPPEQLIKLPTVVNLSVDSARHLLNDAGFTKLSIGGGGDTLTSASIVESQTPRGGTFVTPNTLVLLVASARPLPTMPNLIGQRRQVARIVAELDSLRMIVVSENRKFRMHDEIVSQDPVARSPRRRDNTVDVVVEIPFIPPLAAAVLGLGVVGGAGGETVRRWRRRIRNGRPPSAVSLKPVKGEPTPPVLHADGRDSLIKAAFTLRFGMDSGPFKLEVPGDSLVKPKEQSDA
jgi:beta-lactam-binding protein with PASTA domain